MTATHAATICARCGAGGQAAGGACARCGTRVGARPAGPPTTARCPVCGTSVVGDRTTCPGCGLAVPGSRRPHPATAPPGRWRSWQVAGAAVALVGVGALLAVLAGRGGPPVLDTRWRVDLGTAAVGGATVSGDTALVATAEGALVAVDARQGTPRWRFLTEQQVTAPVAAAGGLAVLATTGDDGAGLVFAVDLRTGQERWRVETDRPVTDAPAVDERGVYLARGDLSAHDPATGDQRWRRPVEGGAGALSVGGGTVVAVGGDGVVAHSTDAGELLWSSGGGRPEVAPGVVGDLAVVGDGTGSVVARALDRGQERWRVGIGGRLLQPVVAGPDLAVVVTTRGVLALGVADGGERWRAGPARDPLVRAASDGTVVAARTASGVLRLDGLTGDVVASARLAQRDGAPAAAAPAVTADAALVVAEDGELVALR